MSNNNLPTPPNPESGRWLITEYAHSWVNDCLYIAVTTDVPVHLYLRWTMEPPKTHLEETEQSGLSMNWDPRFCFVEYNQVEQNEAGDTLYHTFHFCGWAICEHRWWLFLATVAGTTSPSISCIFHAHYLDYEEVVSLRHIDLTHKEIDGIIDHADRSIPPEKLTFIAGADYPIQLTFPHEVIHYTLPGWSCLSFMNTFYTAKFAYYIPIFITKPMPFTEIRWNLYGPVAPNIRLALYSWQDGAPHNRLWQSGKLPHPTTGWKLQTISWELQRGYYFLAFIADLARQWRCFNSAAPIIAPVPHTASYYTYPSWLNILTGPPDQQYVDDGYPQQDPPIANPGEGYFAGILLLGFPQAA